MIYSVILFFFSMWIVLEHINIISGKYLTIYRHLWNARDEITTLDRFHLPIQYYHTSVCETNVCNTTQSCTPIVTKIQDEHMTRHGWHDIAYNFLIDGSGNIYEGTGWYRRTIRNEKEFLSICLFGIEDYETPPKEFLDGLQNILQFGKEIGYLSQVIKPLLNFNIIPDNMTSEYLQKQEDWRKIIISSEYESSSNEYPNQENNVENTKIISDIDWSKVFPHQGNRTALDIIMSRKQIIEKSNWNKVFKSQNEVTSIDWSNLLKDNSRDQVNWSKIFNNDNFDASNLRMFYSSDQLQIKSKLGRNNDW